MFYTKNNGTLLKLTLYRLNIMSYNIFRGKTIWFKLQYSNTQSVYTKLRFHPLQIIHVITTLLFVKYPYMSNVEQILIHIIITEFMGNNCIFLKTLLMLFFFKNLEIRPIAEGKSRAKRSAFIRRSSWNTVYFALPFNRTLNTIVNI